MFAVVLISVCLLEVHLTVGMQIYRRSVINLREVVECAVNASQVYVGYGCFCGLGAKGTDAVDAVDKCCETHDKCYGTTKCGPISIYSENYEFDCKDEVPKCKTKNGCGGELCGCDVAFASCLAQHPVPTKRLGCATTTSTTMTSASSEPPGSGTTEGAIRSTTKSPSASSEPPESGTTESAIRSTTKSTPASSEPPESGTIKGAIRSTTKSQSPSSSSEPPESGTTESAIRSTTKSTPASSEPPESGTTKGAIRSTTKSPSSSSEPPESGTTEGSSTTRASSESPGSGTADETNCPDQKMGNSNIEIIVKVEVDVITGKETHKIIKMQ